MIGRLCLGFGLNPLTANTTTIAIYFQDLKKNPKNRVKYWHFRQGKSFTRTYCCTGVMFLTYVHSSIWIKCSWYDFYYPLYLCISRLVLHSHYNANTKVNKVGYCHYFLVPLKNNYFCCWICLFYGFRVVTSRYIK